MNQIPQLNCGICGHLHDYGHGHYDLRKVAGYEFRVCGVCWDANWDGWNSRHDADIAAHLKRDGLPVPPRLPNGLFPREWRNSTGI